MQTLSGSIASAPCPGRCRLRPHSPSACPPPRSTREARGSTDRPQGQLRLACEPHLPTRPRRAATVPFPSVSLLHESHWEVQARSLNHQLGYWGLGARTRPFLVAVAERAGWSGASVSWGQVLSGQVSVKTYPKNHPEAPLPATAGAAEATPSLLGTGQIKRTPLRPSRPLGAWAYLGSISHACGSISPWSLALRAGETEAIGSEGTVRGEPALGPSLPEGFHRACGRPRPAGAGGQRVCAGSMHLPQLPDASRGRCTPVIGQVTAGREVRPGPGQHSCGPCHTLGLHDSPTSFLGWRGRKKALG